MRYFRILHLTDIHWEEDEKVFASDRRDDWTQRILAVAEAHDGFDLVVCTGDIGHRGEVKNITGGFNYLQTLLKSLSTFKICPLVVTPGNHDVEWPKAGSPTAWRVRDRCKQFILSCSTLTDIKVFRPLMLGESPKDLDWFYWDRHLNIFVLPLSSVHASGTVLLATKDYRHVVDDILSKLPESGLADTIKSLMTADIPFVDIEQTTRFKELVQSWKNSADGELFEKAIKIAAVHHPLFPVLGETESDARAFDTPLNGMRVVKFLSEHGFHLLLYGHKHKMGICLNHGTWNDYKLETSDIYEIVTSVAGNFATFENNDEKGFQEITISIPDSNESNLTEICLKRYFVDGREPKSYCLTEIQSSGKARWIHAYKADGSKRAPFIRREDNIAKGFREAARNVEQLFREKKRLDQADVYLLEKILEIDEYAKGPRGVGTRDFVDRMKETARSASTIIFVDYSGNETWLQPDLMEHLALLLRIYAERNGHLMRCGEAGQRTWRHRHPIETLWNEIRVGPDDPCDSFGAEPFRSASGDATPLEFDMMRILAWDKKSLSRQAARMLKRLHCVFDVPLIWINKDELQDDLILKILDFHLVWNKKDCPTSFAEEPKQQNTPDEGMLFQGGMRVPMNNLTKQRCWLGLCQLIEKKHGPGSALDELVIEND